MNFRTPLDPKPSAHKIDHDQPILSLGSCFAEHIAGRLIDLKFKALSNPFGISYNPLSLANQLTTIRINRQYEKIDLRKTDDHWISFDHHGSFSSTDSGRTLTKINTELERAQERTGNYRWTTLSLGTAWAWFLNDEVVNNCHRLPAQEFTFRLLEIDEIVAALRYSLEQWKTANPEVQVLITVSPVRHLRSGMIDNNRSKARLLESTHALCDQLDFVHYYPSWELVMDDLRDYRFYQSDHIHLSPEAIAYIWEHFSATFFASHTQDALQAFQSFQQLLRHRPRSTTGAAFEGHLRQIEKSFAAWRQRWPSADWSREEERWKALLNL